MFCPLCEDPAESVSPSASLNADRGEWNCLKTDDHGGSVYDLVQTLKARPEGFAMRATATVVTPTATSKVKLKVPPPLDDQDKVYDWHEQMVARFPERVEYLTTQRGLSRETIGRFKLGHDGQRFTIPIRYRGKWVAVKRYLPNAGKAEKMLNLPGHGTGVLAFTEVLAQTLPVLLVEGEFDALLANQIGEGQFVAVTATGGAGTVPGDLSMLAGREVFVLYDNDDAGQKGAEKIAGALRKTGASVHVLDWTPLGLPAGDKARKDLTDWVMKARGTAEQIVAEMNRARSDDDFDPEAEREAKIEEQAEWLRVQRDARARLAAEGWEPPPAQGSWADQMDEPDDPINWLIPELVFEGANVVVNAQAKSGKTSLILNVAHALLSGDPLFGHFDVRALPADRSIAWWNAELFERQAKAWLRDFEVPRPQDFYPLHLRGYAMPFDVEQVESWAVEWLRERRVSVWLIDPQSALFTGEENSNTELGAWLSAIDRIKRRAGVETAFLVHHVSETTGEEGDDPNSGRLLKGRGASRLSGWADVLWSYSGRFDEPRYLAALGRDVDLPPFGGLHMAPGSRLLRWNGTRSTPTEDRRNSLALAAFDQVKAHGEPMKAGELQSALPGKKPDTKRRAIQHAVAQRWIKAEPGRQNSTLYSPGEVDPQHVRLRDVRSENQ
ncbi:hypothetical protein DCE94_12400 [Agromyces badenianii]|nr:hypothetical protein DCE94_12400 [Agromyces badenianii]